MRQRIMAILAIVTTVLAGPFAFPAAANADYNTNTHCLAGTAYWPETGTITTTASGTVRKISLSFEISQTRLNELACHGGYVKIDFAVNSAGVSGAQYSVETNITTQPVLNQSPVSGSFDPGIIGVAVTAFMPNQAYHLTVTWTSSTSATFTARFGPQRRAGGFNELQWCQRAYYMCWLSPYGPYPHVLTGPAPVSLVDNGYYTIT
jgi:hypothetical protein